MTTLQTNRPRRVCAAILALLTITVAPIELSAQAALSCPPYTPPAGPNLLRNTDFEQAGPCGVATWWLSPIQNNCGVRSAAGDWFIHTGKKLDSVATSLVPSALPIGGGGRMVSIQAAGVESGIWQAPPAGLKKVMASAWVFVRSGHVVMGVQAVTAGPYSWSTKTKEWELLRVCTDGSVPVDWFFIYNWAPAGAISRWKALN